MSYTHLINLAKQYLQPEKVSLVERAYAYATRAHEGQVRKSGDPYLEHPLQTALILAELQFDASTLAAALLHDVPENCNIPVADIEKEFGAEVGKLVDGATRLDKLAPPSGGTVPPVSQVENLRKMLVAMAEDLRVVFIKLADRLHNMRTLGALPADRQHDIAQETLEIYAPLAHRLGIWEIKWQLEDLCFHYLEPLKYKQVAARVAAKRTQRESFITQVVEILKSEFDKAGLKVELSGRPKHIYSIHQKMLKYAAQGKDFDDIHDLLALRVLVDTVPECYTAVGTIHNLWHPLPDEFDDFIANPKPNGYQSLHTTVMCLGTTPLEIQIRTHEMHHLAEYGVAAHWRYKEGARKDMHFEERIAWLRQLIEWQRDVSGAEEFIESIKTDILIDQVFVYTPKGEIKDLPKGSTPVDFAYHVHTELGHRCIGAKVNGRLVPFNYHLRNGDVVEIIQAKKGKGPSRDWLSPHLGYVNTSSARQKIRQWFKKQERTENIDRGRDILDKELRHLGIRLNEREELSKLFKYDSLDDFLFAVGYGGVTTQQIVQKLAAQEEAPKPSEPAPAKPAAPLEITVLGQGAMLTRTAQCCNPMRGDKIIGYVTRSRGVTIHRQDCYNVLHEDEKERLIPVEWEMPATRYLAKIKVEAYDRLGLIRDITTVVAEEKMNITSVSSAGNGNRPSSELFAVEFTLETAGLPQLSRLISRIDGVRGVTSVTRLGDEAPKRTGSPA